MKIFNLSEDNLNFQFNYNNQETELLNQSMNNNADFTLHDLRRIALWKLDRVLNVPEDLLEQMREIVKDKELTIEDLKIKNIINNLLECSGIGMPMASTILKFLRPDVFPIIDARAYRAIYGKKLYSPSYTFDRYKEYVLKLYEIRDQLNLELYEVDQQLYCFDKEYNGKI